MSSMMNVARADLNDTTMLERRYLLQRLLHSNRQSLGFGPCNGQERQIGIVPVMAEFEVKPPPFTAGIHHPVGRKRSSSRGGRASSRKSQSGGAAAGGGAANNGDDDFQLPLLLHTRDEAVLSREEWRSFLDLGRRFEISPAMRKTILSGGRGNNSARFSRSSSSKHKPPPGGVAALVEQLQRSSVFGGGGGAGSGPYDQQEVTKTKSGRIVAERARINSVEIDDYDATTGGTAAPLTSSRVAPDESDRSPFTVTKLPSILKNGNGERLGLYPLETKRISLGAGGQESIPLGENDNIKTLLGLEPLPTLEQRARSSLKENAPSEEVALETPPVAEADHAASRNMFSFPAAYGGDHQADGFTRSGQLRRKTISAASELERSFDSDFLPGGGGAASFTGVPFGSFDIEKTTAFSGASASTPASLRKARISVDRIDEAEDEEKAASTLTPAATSPMKLRASGASPGSMIPRAGRGLQRSATVEAGVGVSQASPSFRSSHLGMGGAALSSLTSSSLKRRVTGLTGVAAPAAISSGGSAVVLAGTGSPPHVKGSATSMSGDVVGAGDGVCSPRVVRKTPSRSQTMSQLRKKVTLDLDDHDEGVRKIEDLKLGDRGIPLIQKAKRFSIEEASHFKGLDVGVLPTRVAMGSPGVVETENEDENVDGTSGIGGQEGGSGTADALQKSSEDGAEREADVDDTSCKTTKSKGKGRSTQQRSGEKYEKRHSSRQEDDEDDEDEHHAGDQHGGNLPFDKRATGQDYPEDLDEDSDFCDVEERRDETGLISLDMKPGPDTSSASTPSKSSRPAEVEQLPPPHINDADKGKRLSRNLRKRLLQVVQERAPFLNLDDRKTTFFGRRSTERGVNPRDLGEMFHVRYFTFVMHFPESKLYIDRLAWHHERKGKMLSEADLENVFDEVQHSLTGLLLGYTTGTASSVVQNENCDSPNFFSSTPDALSTVQKRNAAAVEHVRGDRAMDFMMEVGLYPLVDEEEKILRDTLHKYLRANHLNSTTTQPNSGDHRGAGGCGGTAPSTASSSGGANSNKPQLLQAAAAISRKGPLPFEVLRKIQLQPSDVVNVIRETLESFQAIYDDQKAKVIEDYELERTVIPTFYTVTKQSGHNAGGGGGTNSNSGSSPGPAAGVEKGSQTSPAAGAAPGSPQNLQQQNINHNKGNHLHQVEDETHMLRDLLELYKAFCQMDSRKCGVLSGKQLDELSRTVFGENRAGKQKYLHNVTQVATNTMDVTFCDFLRLVHKRRLDDLEDMKMDLWRMTPQRVFYPPEEDLSDLQIRKPGRQTLDVGAIEKHQKLHSHTLTQADVCRMLARLEIFPKSTAEQLQIQEILELVFPTANDVLSFEQFQYLCKKIQNLLNFKYAESELNYVHQFFTPRQISAFRKHFERLTADNAGGGGLAFDAAGSSGSSASCGGGAPASLVAGGGGAGGAAYYSIADTARIPLAQVRSFLLVSYKITIEPPELWKFLEEEVLLCASSRGGNGDGSLDGGNIDPLSARRMSIKRKSVHDMTAAVLANMKETLLVTTTTPGPGAAGAADTTASPVLGSSASSSVPGAGSSMTGAAGGSSKNGAAPENGDADFAALSITHDSTTPASNQGMAGVAAFNPTYVMSTSDGGHAMVQFGATEEIESAAVPVKPTKSKREPVIFVGPSDIAPSAAAAAGAIAGAPGGGGGIMGAAAPSASGASGTSPGSISPGRAALGGKGYADVNPLAVEYGRAARITSGFGMNQRGEFTLQILQQIGLSFDQFVVVVHWALTVKRPTKKQK
eukprot:g5412.t1